MQQGATWAAWGCLGRPMCIPPRGRSSQGRRPMPGHRRLMTELTRRFESIAFQFFSILFNSFLIFSCSGVASVVDEADSVRGSACRLASDAKDCWRSNCDRAQRYLGQQGLQIAVTRAVKGVRSQRLALFEWENMAKTDDWSRDTYQTTYRLAYNNHSPEQFQERVPWPLKP